MPDKPIPDESDIALARRFLDEADEDWTFIDPEDVKRLARRVVLNQIEQFRREEAPDRPPRPEDAALVRTWTHRLSEEIRTALNDGWS
jgi:hypothetical protein